MQTGSTLWHVTKRLLRLVDLRKALESGSCIARHLFRSFQRPLDYQIFDLEFCRRAIEQCYMAWGVLQVIATNSSHICFGAYANYAVSSVLSVPLARQLQEALTKKNEAKEPAIEITFIASNSE